MHYNRIYVVILITFVLFTIVKGSCLEYGHSCWGAHGKRSGGSAAGGGSKLMRAAANLRNNENDAQNNNKALFESMDELNAPSANKEAQHTINNDEPDERNSMNIQDLSKLRNFIRKHNERLRSRNRNNDDSMEQEEKFIERWRKLPLFNLKPLTKSQFTNTENDLLQQPSKVLITDDSFYDDFP